MQNIDMPNDLQDDAQAILEDIKKKLNKKLEGNDWMERMTLKCQSYIEQNGVKTTTVEEIFDNIWYEAINTFPRPIKEEMEAESKKMIDQFLRNF